MPAASYTMLRPDSPAITFEHICSQPACISGILESDAPPAAPPGRL